MADKQQNKRTTRYSLLLWLILILLLLGASVGGAAAYLSASRGPLVNTLVVDEHPTITVNDDTITVQDPGYAVYLRAAVMVNWKNTSNGNLLAEVPTEGTDYNLSLGTNWFLHTDGFYYYKDKMFDGENDANMPLPAFTLNPITTKTGYELTMKIAAQTVQAVGTTDTGDKDAVEDAWGVTPQQITGTP